MGTDWDPRRPERVRFGIRTDVFVIVTWVDHWRDGITDLAFFPVPRDLWVKVPCSPLDPALEGYDRVNAAWTYGGFDCVKQMVKTNFGLEVNAPMFLVEMLAFVDLVDIFSPLLLTPKETYSDWCGDFLGTEGRGAYMTWQAGREYSMDGNFLLCYLRARAGAASGDLDRNRRALEALEAMKDQYPKQIVSDPAKLPEMAVDIWGIISEYLESDIRLRDITKFAPMVPSALEDDVQLRMIRLTLDEVDFWRTPIYNASVLKPQVKLADWFGCMLAVDDRTSCDDLWQCKEGSVWDECQIGKEED